MRYWILIFLVSFGEMLHASDVVVDGICYGIIGSRWAFVTHPDDWQGRYAGDVTVPAQISHNGRSYEVISVGENAFAGCDALTSVRLPFSVRAVSACAFLGCTNLREIFLPTTIQAFASCAFTGCTSLQEITLPRHAELVDTLTFYCCSSLTSVVLPHSVNKVCWGAFEHLPAMRDLYCFAETPPVAEKDAFSLADQQQVTLHVPAGALASYRESPVWSEFSHVIPLGDEDYLKQDYRRGDINDDGTIDIEDVNMLRRLIVRQRDETAVPWAADVNGDGIVNAVDFVLLTGEL